MSSSGMRKRARGDDTGTSDTEQQSARGDDSPQKRQKVSPVDNLEMSDTSDKQSEEVSEAERIENFERFLKENGVDHPNFVFKRSDFGFGAFATRDIAENEIIGSIPLRNVLTFDKVSQSSIGKKLSKGRPDLKLKSILMAFLIESKCVVNNEWTVYIRAMPDEYDDPMWWSDEELEFLKGTYLYRAVLNKRKELEGQHSMVAKLLSQEDGYPAGIFTWERFLWAYSAFHSRSFPRAVGIPTSQRTAENEAKVSNEEKDVGCMLPCWDMLNHKYRHPVEWVTDDNHISFRALRHIPRGGEVYNNYGSKGNQQLLASYGFCYESNEHDEVDIQLGIDGEDESAPEKLRIIQEIGLKLTHSLNLLAIPKGLIAVLRVLSLSPSELECHLSPSLDVFTKRISTRNELSALSTLHSLIVQSLMTHQLSFRDISADDHSRISSRSRHRLSVATIYRRGQISVLEKSLRHVLSLQREEIEFSRGKCSTVDESKEAADVEPSASEDARCSDYRRWIEDSGGVCHLTFPSESQEVSLRTHCSSNVPYLTIPISICISMKSIQEDTPFWSALQLIGGLDEQTQLVLYVVKEMHNPTSKWRPFFDCVDLAPLPFTWSSDEMKLLGSEAHADVAGKLEEVRELYGDLFPALFGEAFEGTFPEDVFTLKAFVEASALVESRLEFAAVPESPPEPLIVPLLRLFSPSYESPTQRSFCDPSVLPSSFTYTLAETTVSTSSGSNLNSSTSTSAETTVSTSSGGNSIESASSKGVETPDIRNDFAFIYSSPVAMGRGEIATYRYSSADSLELVSRYGLVCCGSKAIHEAIEYRPPFESMGQESLQALHRRGLTRSYRIGCDTDLSPKLIECFKVCAMSPEQLMDVEKHIADDNVHRTAMITLKNVLRKQVDELESISSTEAGACDISSMRSDIAQRYRLGRLRVLNSAIARCETM